MVCWNWVCILVDKMCHGHIIFIVLYILHSWKLLLHMLRKEDDNWWRRDCQACKLKKEDAVDCSRWRKFIKDVWWSGWVWVGECFFWYRPIRVVPDKVPLNGCTCVCVCLKDRCNRYDIVWLIQWLITTYLLLLCQYFWQLRSQKTTS